MAPAVFTIQLKEINANFRIDKRWNILKVSPIKHLFILKTLLSSYFLGEKPFWTMFSHLFLLAHVPPTLIQARCYFLRKPYLIHQTLPRLQPSLIMFIIVLFHSTL